MTNYEVLEQFGDREDFVISDYDGTGCLEVVRNDATFQLSNDQEAAELAYNLGCPIIPVDELPKGFKRRYFGWIDTEENRQCIQELADKMNSIS